MSQKTSTDPLTIQIPASLPALVFPEPEAGGFSAEVPASPGCYAQGESLPEVEANLREAIEGWLASAHDEAIEQSAVTAALPVARGDR